MARFELRWFDRQDNRVRRSSHDDRVALDRDLNMQVRRLQDRDGGWVEVRDGDELIRKDQVAGS